MHVQQTEIMTCAVKTKMRCLMKTRYDNIRKCKKTKVHNGPIIEIQQIDMAFLGWCSLKIHVETHIAGLIQTDHLSTCCNPGSVEIRDYACISAKPKIYCCGHILQHFSDDMSTSYIGTVTI